MDNSDLNITLQTALNGSAKPIRIDVNDYLVERYVRFVETLDKATERVVGDRVQNHIGVKAMERFYRQFYNEYDKLESRVTPRVNAFVSSLFD